tara:strand:+ start:2337 stop:2597 length:261 start_codon:yes stop_codon:yes gene_type:complete
MSSFGYQPTPLRPIDFEDFLEYQREINNQLRQNLHEPRIISQPIKPSVKKPKEVKPKLKKTNKKSTNSNKNGELRNRNRSVKSNVY